MYFKLDNCSTQDKCKWIFQFWNNLAKKLSTKVIIYYGVSAHGKGLVDAMSAIGVKSPLSTAVITKNLHCNSAEDIHQDLSDLFKDDKTKLYTILTSEDIESFKNDNSPLIIKGCMKLHRLSFFPDGSIQSKINICSCKSCVEGDLVSCLTEKGKTVQQVTEVSDDDSTTESEFENDYDDESDAEAYELRSESVNSVLTKNTTIG